VRVFKCLFILLIAINSMAVAADDKLSPAMGGKQMFLTEKDIMAVIGQLQAKFKKAKTEQIESGVHQVARLWKEKDGSAGDFAKFCSAHFMTGKDRDALFARFERKLELLSGHMNALSIELQLEMHEDLGPLLPVDHLFAAFSPGAHLSEDMFKSKLAFVSLLNFSQATLEQKVKKGGRWSRRQWAEVRLAAEFAHRVPAEIIQEISKVSSQADSYIAAYNICMDHVVAKDKKPMFRKDLKLISHWGLRDELKAKYADPNKNLAKQEMIYTIMQRIIDQEIPRVVIDNPKVNWDPVANTVDGKPAEREADTRYQHLLATFNAVKQLDPYYPDAATQIKRAFELEREMPEQDVVALLESVLKAPASKEVAKLIEKRLGRKLRPFDIWYDGFKARADIDERKLDKIVAEKYADIEAFQNGLPEILDNLGFDKKTAAYLSERIEVDPARGAGHAWGPQMRTEKAHLRTRVPAKGMNYKGFNIGMHELGHTVEQVFSLYKVDHTLLEGVPNNAFTEGFAFVFQGRDLQVLGLSKPDKKKEALKALDIFWATREIAGVALVDIKVWHWMYEHPKATPAQLRQAVIKIAKDIWNQHYADVFGHKDSPILAVYSHMISYGLYLSHYPLGHIIAFQIEDYFKTHKLAKEMERMCLLGNILPNMWMKKAVGAKISTKPLNQAALSATKTIKN